MLKVGDLVLIITGKFKGKTGKISRILSKRIFSDKVVCDKFVCIEGITFIKHLKGKDPVTKDRKIHISNVKKIPS